MDNSAAQVVFCACNDRLASRIIPALAISFFILTEFSLNLIVFYLLEPMALNWIWFLFFGVAFVVALIQFIFFGNSDIFKILVDGMFDSAEVAVMKVALPLTGVMAFFMGILQVGEKAGAIHFLARKIQPFFSRLFPEVPKDHPVHGQMIMNFSDNGSIEKP